jgi:hypothetical protein
LAQALLLHNGEFFQKLRLNFRRVTDQELPSLLLQRDGFRVSLKNENSNLRV